MGGGAAALPRTHWLLVRACAGVLRRSGRRVLIWLASSTSVAAVVGGTHHVLVLVLLGGTSSGTRVAGVRSR